jgi:hypothetical protein
VTGIITFRTGFPFSLLANDNSLSGPIWSRVAIRRPDFTRPGPVVILTRWPTTMTRRWMYKGTDPAGWSRKEVQTKN